MKRSSHALLSRHAAVWLVSLTTCSSFAQTFERDVSVTGPRGRTLERKTEIQRTPGGLERSVQVNRPAGSFSRQVEIHRSPGFAPGRPMYGPGPRFGPPPPSGPSTGALVGLGLGMAALPAIGFAAGMAASRPPVIVAPAPVIAAPAVVATPVIPAPSPHAVDPVNLAAQKLYSNYFGTRRDGAVELGRLGDPRGIPALTYVLKNDNFKEVRIAAARALGEIGGPEAVTVLERCLVYEKRQPVRDAASAALHQAKVHEVETAVITSPAVSTVPRLSARTMPSNPSNTRAPAPPTPRPPVHVESTPRHSSTSNYSWTRSGSGQQSSTLESTPSSSVESTPTLEGPEDDTTSSSVGDRTPPPPPTPVSP